MTLKLVKGEFSSLEEALRRQMLVMDEKLFLLDQENKLNLHTIAELREDLLQVEAHKERLRKRCAEEYRKRVKHIKRYLARK